MIFVFTGGPVIDSNMKLFLISSRDTDSIILFTLSFMVTHGPPSTVNCYYDGVQFLGKTQSRQEPPGLSREVIRSHYINSSYPDMTRVTLTLTAPREPRVYACTVIVEGRVNIDNDNYDFAPMGSGTTTVNITGECVHEWSTAHYTCSLSLSSQLQALQQMLLLTGLVMTVLGFPGLPHQQEQHQLAMRCSTS